MLFFKYKNNNNNNNNTTTSHNTPTDRDFIYGGLFVGREQRNQDLCTIFSLPFPKTPYAQIN
jgi:hypothetical protein